MFIAKDHGDHYLLSRDIPTRMQSFWKPQNEYYTVINKKLGEELFPGLTWKDEPKEINDIKLF